MAGGTQSPGSKSVSPSLLRRQITTKPEARAGKAEAEELAKEAARCEGLLAAIEACTRVSMLLWGEWPVRLLQLVWLRVKTSR